MREFDLGDILSVTTGRLVSPRHIGGVYDILGYMTGEELFTHQLPRASSQCEGPLLRQLPQLADVEVPDDFGGTEEAVFAWLGKQKATYGETLPVEPISDGAQAPNPIEELCDMVGAEKVFVAGVDRLVAVPTAVKTGAYTAAANDLIPVDTTSGPVTVTLPTGPADKTRVAADESLPAIYLFSNSRDGDGVAYAMAEDGTVLGSHFCSHWGYMRHDLHDRVDRKAACEAHYPNGYRLIVLMGSGELPPTEVIARNREQARKDES